MSNHTLELNVIPLNCTLGEQRFSFYKTKQQGENFAPLRAFELPSELSHINSTIYSDFQNHPDADLIQKINLKESPEFAKHYLNAKLYRWFKNKAYLRRRNFINNTELYFLADSESGAGKFAKFDRFVLRATVGRFTEKAELTVMYRGSMKVWKNSIVEYPGRSEDFTKVVYEKNLYRFNEFNEICPNADREKVFPVLNRFIADTLSLPPIPWKKINKMKRHSDKIHEFYEKWITDPDFEDKFSPSADGFMQLGEEETGRVGPDATLLRFGKNFTSKDPYEGLSEGGPFRAPDATHVELFFIVSAQDAKSAGNRLFKSLRSGLGHFKGLKSFAKIPVYVSDRNMTFSNMDNPLPEIRKKLQNESFKKNVQYCAVYISPIKKNDPEIRKQRVYYRLKEELLKYNITSQVISNDSVLDPNFHYYLPNIATALIAKLGGTPWTLKENQNRELVIGIGAYRPSHLKKTYLGSAFCFTNNGDFKGFESFTSDDVLMLAGSFQRAIREYRETYSDIDRVVLHFYKKISREEEQLLINALSEMKLDIPLVILTIHKTKSRDLLIANMDKPHRLPLSGIYYRSGKRQYLLCNNTFFDEPDDNIRSFPFPVKVYFDIAGDESDYSFMEDSRWVEDLLEQVYRFSRLNWQTVSIKSMPVTVAYPEMVAEKFPYFDGDIIPEFGQENFWFL